MAPFRQAGSADGRRPLCTFFLPPTQLAGGGDGDEDGDGDRDGETAKTEESSVSGKRSNDAAVGKIEKADGKTRVKPGGRESGVAAGDGSKPSTDTEREGAEDAADRRGGGPGRAFAYPPADSSPAATHVINYIEDNPDLAWRPSALRGPRRRSVQHLRHTRGNEHDPGHDDVASASESEASRTRSAKGKRRRNPEDEDGDEESAGVWARMRSKRWGGGDKQVGTETAVVAGTAVAAGGRLLEEPRAPLTPAAAVLPDIVGAGGFAEFIPLLDTVFGR